MQKSAFTKCICITFVALVFVFIVGQKTVHSQQNNNNGNSQQTQTNQNVTITEPVKVHLEPDKEEIEAEKAYKTRQEQRDESNATWNRRGIVVNVFLFILVLVQSFFSFRSLQQMRRQADITENQFGIVKSQLDTMEIQTSAMKEQTVTMQRQAEIMQSQTDLMESGLEETRKIIEQNERAVKASEIQAKSSEETVKITNEMFYISERAYVAIKNIKLQPSLTSEGFFGIQCTVINTGKTPASDIFYTFVPKFEKVNKPLERPIFPANSKMRTELSPNVETLVAPQKLVAVSHEQFAKIAAGTELFVVFVEIRYKCLQIREEVSYFRYVYNPNKLGFRQETA